MKQSYHPLYFLSALGNGGLAVSFFMYFMFLIPHPDSPLPHFDHLRATFGSGGMAQLLVVAVSIIILALAANHFRLLVWNIRSFHAFKRTSAYQTLKGTPGEVAVMAEPLTYAMSVNVLFILGALFVPGLWANVQFLFPFALAAFLVIGVYALVRYVQYIANVVANGTFPVDNLNQFGQFLGAFTFVMVAVGLASPAAMATTPWVSVISTVASLFFLSLVGGILLFFGGMSLRAVLAKGLAKPGAPTIWLLIPIFTLTGITFVRLYSMVSHRILDTDVNTALLFVVLGFLFMASTAVGLIGFNVLHRLDYFDEQPDGAASFGLICPGVAYVVLGMFFVHWGLVQNGFITAHSLMHYVILSPLVFIQMKTIQWLIKLSVKHLTKRQDVSKLEAA
ncbi:hypothetical protein [Exiguobacterium sp.]|uniref:TsoY family (seleno)protein n=1 Tax=Exiguobacterium sp. TaxID=44751 RepID=UPI00263AFB41|nr:hypothetical protein [Exiguobacterium sp.]MCC5893716.1 hypothetical protein [Exiguobacterium sp.]